MPTTYPLEPLPEESHIFYLADSPSPALEILAAPGSDGDGSQAKEVLKRIPFKKAGKGRKAGETLWAAEIPPDLDSLPLTFRIELSAGLSDPAGPDRYYRTPLHSLWLQDGQIFSYRPAQEVSASQVVKIPYFQGSLSTRPLYIYLPRGYHEHAEHDYPVIYMQDGQNTFEAFVEDSYVGSWRTEEIADRSIQAGRMQECLIVGVSHGGDARLEEYLPPYASIHLQRRRRFRPGDGSKKKKGLLSLLSPGQRAIYGRADRTFEYYQGQVAPFIAANYRARQGREDIAMCGSSMAGLFSLYVAWDHSEFARNFAAISPSFRATREKSGGIPILEHLRQAPLPDIRLWLDSGTLDTPGGGDDGFPETLQARDILIERGLVEGDDFHFLLDQGGIHNEVSWSSRLPKVFEFFFPVE